jgi:hypothetical protein
MPIFTISKETWEVIMSNRAKAKELFAGERVMFLDGRGLSVGEVVTCDACPNVSTINVGWHKMPTETELRTLRFCKSTRFLMPEEIYPYDEDGSGDTLCPECRAKRETKVS